MKTKLSQLPAIIRVLIPAILLADCFAAAGWERRVVPQNCGLLSLREVAKVLRPEDTGAVPSTNGAIGEKGISLMDLAEVGRQMNLNLVPVRRLSGQELLVPSLAYWRENHYVAILDKRGEDYRVFDAALNNTRWLAADAINARISGQFLAPASELTENWRRLSASEAEQIVGGVVIAAIS